MKLDEWDSGSAEIKDYSYPETLVEQVEETVEDLGYEGYEVVGYTVKAGTEYFTYGEQPAGTDIDPSTNDVVFDYNTDTGVLNLQSDEDSAPDKVEKDAPSGKKTKTVTQENEDESNDITDTDNHSNTADTNEPPLDDQPAPSINTRETLEEEPEDANSDQNKKDNKKEKQEKETQQTNESEENTSTIADDDKGANLDNDTDADNGSDYDLFGSYGVGVSANLNDELLPGDEESIE